MPNRGGPWLLVCCVLVMGLCNSFTLMVGVVGVLFSIFMYFLNTGRVKVQVPLRLTPRVVSALKPTT